MTELIADTVEAVWKNAGQQREDPGKILTQRQSQPSIDSHFHVNRVLDDAGDGDVVPRGSDVHRLRAG